MPVRTVVSDFVALGPLPDSHAAEALIATHQERLHGITPPVSDDEAAVLVECFGPDDCYGLAWTLLHLIETAPAGPPLHAAPEPDASEWLHRLWRRMQRAKPKGA